MNFIVLGTSEFTICCARGLMGSGANLSASISMPSESRPDNSADLSSLAGLHGIPDHEIVDINSEDSLELLRSYTLDYLLSTRPRMLKTEVLPSSPGMHR